MLTSTFTWGIVRGAIDVVQSIVEGGRGFAAGTVAWILAHANALVPLIFVGVILWLVKQKPKQ